MEVDFVKQKVLDKLLNKKYSVIRRWM